MKMECAEQEIYIRLEVIDWNTHNLAQLIETKLTPNAKQTVSQTKRILNVVEFSAFLALFPPTNLFPWLENPRYYATTSY